MINGFSIWRWSAVCLVSTGVCAGQVSLPATAGGVADSACVVHWQSAGEPPVSMVSVALKNPLLQLWLPLPVVNAETGRLERMQTCMQQYAGSNGVLKDDEVRQYIRAYHYCQAYYWKTKVVLKRLSGERAWRAGIKPRQRFAQCLRQAMITSLSPDNRPE